MDLTAFCLFLPEMGVSRSFVTRMDERGQEQADEHQPVLRAGGYGPLPRSSGSLAWRRSCHNGPISSISSAVTPAVSPVIRQMLVITTLVELPTTRP